MIKVLEYTKNPLKVMGKAASICYNSIELEDVLTGARDKRAIGIAKHCMSSGHTRISEYADVTLLLDSYSARVIRELYTHIVGTTRVQASTRYIEYSDAKFGYYVPDSIRRNEEAKEVYDSCMGEILDSYSKLLSMGVKQQDAANLLPLGHHTRIVLKINLRALMHMFEVRTCTRAYEEFRKLMKELKKELMQLDDEWVFICENYFKIKCEKMLYCDEKESCGLYPTKDVMQGLLDSYRKEQRKN